LRRKALLLPHENVISGLGKGTIQHSLEDIDMIWVNKLRQFAAVTLELSLVVFVILLAWMTWGKSSSHADASANALPAASELATSSTLTAVQGTPLVTQVTDAISNQDASFTGQRHFRSGIQGDPGCSQVGTIGTRFYDRVTFSNTSTITQTVYVGFTSNCGNNTYMAAYSPDFDPANICANFLAGAGRTGDAFWSFKVCANSQFSLVVYGVEPGVTCSSYTYSVFGDGIAVTSQALNGLASAPKGDQQWNFPPTDTKQQRLKKKRSMDVRKRLVPIDSMVTSGVLLPTMGTPLVATVTESIDQVDSSFSGQRHFRSGIPGDTVCNRIGFVFSRRYDEFFFTNTSSTPQRINIGSISGCGNNTYMAAYSPQFNPGNACTNFIAGAGLSGNVNWEFTVCPNSTFSVVVYELEPGLACSQYSFLVYGNNISYRGTKADLAVLKTTPPGPVNAGSTLTYTISVSNQGPTSATGIVLTDVLPPGTTFSLLSEPGTPVCTTPPVGSHGTVTCNLRPLAVGPYTIQLRVNVTAGAGPLLTNTASATRFGIDPRLDNNAFTVQTPVNVFDLCVQDESGGNLLAFNQTTGVYSFMNCGSGLTVNGTGTLTKRGCTVILESLAPDRRIRLQIDTCQKTGSASVQLLSAGKSFNFSDRNITNNTCRCGGG
jgi:uncharacterized repeat protein (TIGR01451 family)